MAAGPSLCGQGTNVDLIELGRKAISAITSATRAKDPASLDRTTITVDELAPVGASAGGFCGGFGSSFSGFDGEKFYGGYGVTELYEIDYWTLRKRSAALFTDNLYARGLIRRLITNEINTGLSLESVPNEKILGIDEDVAADWSEDVESRFAIWGSAAKACDHRGAMTFGALQRQARLEALVCGDVLIRQYVSQETKAVKVQLINGDRVQSPTGAYTKARAGGKITHGVETDKRGVQIAYWVKQENGDVKRLPAIGDKSGRRLAWLVYGTDKRLDEVRGQPLLSLALQSLKEMDRNRDAVLRKKAIAATYVMSVEKTQDKMSSLPGQNSAVRRGTATATNTDGSPRTFAVAENIPGVIVEEMQTGEKLVGFSGKDLDDNIGSFESVIISGVAWAYEIPPEILTLAFSSNYSASQAAINEFKIYLNKFWSIWGDAFCNPIYIEWLLTEVIAGRIAAPGLLELWRNPLRYTEFYAYVAAEWYGQIKPSTDTLKQAKGSGMLVDRGFSTNTREARGTTGTNFVANMKRQRKENILKVRANEPLVEAGMLATTAPAAATAADDLGEKIDNLMEALSDGS